MTNNEKTLLLQLVLEDLRGNWAYDAPERAKVALTIATELNLEAHRNRIESYLKDSAEYGDWDGRYFRTTKENGGYEGMDEMHGLARTFKDKSEDFKKEAQNVLTYPQYRFEDWDEDELPAPAKTDTLQKVKEDWDKQAEDSMNGLPTKTDKQTEV